MIDLYTLEHVKNNNQRPKIGCRLQEFFSSFPLANNADREKSACQTVASLLFRPMRSVVLYTISTISHFVLNFIAAITCCTQKKTSRIEFYYMR